MSDKTRDFDSQPKYYVGFCRTCGTGPLGLRTCGDCEAVVVVCDECDSVWADGNLDSQPNTTGLTTLPCPHCKSDLYSPPAHWSTSAEIDAADWLTTAIRSERLALNAASAAKDQSPDEDTPPDASESPA